MKTLWVKEKVRFLYMYENKYQKFKMDQSIFCPFTHLLHNTEFYREYFLKTFWEKEKMLLLYIYRCQIFMVDQSMYFTFNPLPHNFEF